MPKSDKTARPAKALSSETDLPKPLDRRQLIQELREAIDRDELFVCYQPKFRTRTEAIEGAEALVRWLHPVNGLVPPDQFIGLAEDNGLIADLTKWVVSRMLLDRERLQVAGHDLSIHFNLSARLVPDEGFTRWLVKATRGLEPGALGLEITAAALKREPKLALQNLAALGDAGLTIAIDDYGKGAWSLTDLKRMPARELKIDRSLVTELASSPSAPLVMRAIIDLAHALDMQVTAVGVESESAAGLLRMMGCDLIQGFVISPAIEMNDLQDFLAVGPDLLAADQKLRRRAS